MQQRYDVLGFGLLALAVAIFALLDTSFSDESFLFRWKELIGAILGAAMTIGAGWLAYHAVRKQIAYDQAKVMQQQEAAKVAAVTAVSQPVHAAASVLFVMRTAQSARVERGRSALWHSGHAQLATHFERLKTSLKHFTLKEIAGDLNADDRTRYLMVILHLSSFVNIFETTPAEGYDDRLPLLIETLQGVHRYIALLDADLGEVFARDGGMNH